MSVFRSVSKCVLPSVHRASSVPAALMGGAAAWAPSDLSSLGITILPKLAIAQSKLYKDTGKTQLATANGDAVRVQTCPFTGIDVTFTAGWTLNVSGADAWIEPATASASFNLSFERRNFSAGVSLRPSATSAQRILLDSTSAGFAYQENTNRWQAFDGSTIPNSGLFLARSIDTVCGIESSASSTLFRSFSDTATKSVMASGTGTDGRVMCDTITFSAVATTGERVIDLGEMSFDTGLLAIVGGTAANVTIAYE